MVKDEIKNLIAEKSATIGVIGLGYVGLPLIVEFCLKDFQGIGLKLIPKKPMQLTMVNRILLMSPAKMLKNALTREN